MILTNRLGLPRSIENAVRNDPYHKGDAHISVTGLIAPARKRALEIKHKDEITEDVAERIWSLLGQIAHGILERAEDQALTEQRLFIERHGWRISGQYDRYVLEDACLGDYKLTSTYAVKDRGKAEWDAQENIYALMLREHGYRVDRLEVVAILRDWQKSKARHTPDYPQVPVLILPVALWPAAKTEAYITSRLIAHGTAQHEMPECSPEERWERPGVWALYKTGNSRATSFHDTQASAEAAREALVRSHEDAVFEIRERRREWALYKVGNDRATSLHNTWTEAEAALKSAEAAQPKIKYTITESPARQIRCADYCPALVVCAQGKALVRGAEEFHARQSAWVIARPHASAV